MKKLILASSSPYRIELLNRLNIPFSSHSPKVDESQFKQKGFSPDQLAIELAKAKAIKLSGEFSTSIIIGSDQVASLDGEIFDKPGSIENAQRQLQSLHGKTHQLITAVYLWSEQKSSSFINITNLEMNSLTSQQISRYVELEQPLNCAGSYKIEGLGISLFKNVNMSDYTSIIGLPLIELCQHLREHWDFEIP